MNNISKVSDIEVEDIADYLRIDELTEADKQTLNNLLGIAKTYIESYTGRSEQELDNYQDFVIVALVLVQDMYDNRTMYVDSTNLNTVVETILGMHSVNLL
nr:MAG TPA: head tail connector [Caudoviricetes sp.]